MEPEETAQTHRDVVDIEGRLVRATGILNPEAIHVWLVGHAQGGEGESDVLPRVGGKRRQRDGWLGDAIEQGLHLQLLSPGWTAMNPKGEVAVRAGIERIVVQIQRLVRRSSDADGVRARMHRRVVIEIDRRPTPVLPAGSQRIPVNRLVGLRAHRSDEPRQGQNEKTGSMHG